jgi:hypothetical protein
MWINRLTGVNCTGIHRTHSLSTDSKPKPCDHTCGRRHWHTPGFFCRWSTIWFRVRVAEDPFSSPFEEKFVNWQALQKPDPYIKAGGISFRLCFNWLLKSSHDMQRGHDCERSRIFPVNFKDIFCVNSRSISKIFPKRCGSFAYPDPDPLVISLLLPSPNDILAKNLIRTAHFELDAKRKQTTFLLSWILERRRLAWRSMKCRRN